MASLGIKALASIASVGTLAVGGYGIYAYNNTTDTVENYLKKNNLTPRTNNWETVLETYKLEKATATAIETETADGIKDWCNNNLKLNIASTKDLKFKKASKWCIEFEIISDKFNGKSLEQSEEKLNSKLDSFADPLIKGEITTIKISENPDTHKVGKQIKQWCATNSKRRFSNNNDPYYKAITGNCLTE